MRTRITINDSENLSNRWNLKKHKQVAQLRGVAKENNSSITKKKINSLTIPSRMALVDKTNALQQNLSSPLSNFKAEKEKCKSGRGRETDKYFETSKRVTRTLSSDVENDDSSANQSEIRSTLRERPTRRNKKYEDNTNDIKVSEENLKAPNISCSPSQIPVAQKMCKKTEIRSAPPSNDSDIKISKIHISNKTNTKALCILLEDCLSVRTNNEYVEANKISIDEVINTHSRKSSPCQEFPQPKKRPNRRPGNKSVDQHMLTEKTINEPPSSCTDNSIPKVQDTKGVGKRIRNESVLEITENTNIISRSKRILIAEEEKAESENLDSSISQGGKRSSLRQRPTPRNKKYYDPTVNNISDRKGADDTTVSSENHSDPTQSNLKCSTENSVERTGRQTGKQATTSKAGTISEGRSNPSRTASKNLGAKAQRTKKVEEDKELDKSTSQSPLRERTTTRNKKYADMKEPAGKNVQPLSEVYSNKQNVKSSPKCVSPIIAKIDTTEESAKTLLTTVKGSSSKNISNASYKMAKFDSTAKIGTENKTETIQVSSTLKKSRRIQAGKMFNKLDKEESKDEQEVDGNNSLNSLTKKSQITNRQGKPNLENGQSECKESGLTKIGEKASKSPEVASVLKRSNRHIANKTNTRYDQVEANKSSSEMVIDSPSRESSPSLELPQQKKRVNRGPESKTVPQPSPSSSCTENSTLKVSKNLNNIGMEENPVTTSACPNSKTPLRKSGITKPSCSTPISFSKINAPTLFSVFKKPLTPRRTSSENKIFVSNKTQTPINNMPQSTNKRQRKPVYVKDDMTPVRRKNSLPRQVKEGMYDFEVDESEPKPKKKQKPIMKIQRLRPAKKKKVKKEYVPDPETEKKVLRNLDLSPSLWEEFRTPPRQKAIPGKALASTTKSLLPSASKDPLPSTSKGTLPPTSSQKHSPTENAIATPQHTSTPFAKAPLEPSDICDENDDNDFENGPSSPCTSPVRSLCDSLLEESMALFRNIPANFYSPSKQPDHKDSPIPILLADIDRDDCMSVASNASGASRVTDIYQGDIDISASTPIKFHRNNSSIFVHKRRKAADLTLSNCFGFDEPEILEEPLVSPIKSTIGIPHCPTPARSNVVFKKKPPLVAPPVQKEPVDVNNVIKQLRSELGDASSTGPLFSVYEDMETSPSKRSPIKRYFQPKKGAPQESLNESEVLSPDKKREMVPRLSYQRTRKRKVNHDRSMSEDENESDQTGDELDDDENLRADRRPRKVAKVCFETSQDDATYQPDELEKDELFSPNSANKRNTPKKKAVPKKRDKGMTKKEEEELEKWAKMFNSQCAEVEQFGLEFE